MLRDGYDAGHVLSLAITMRSSSYNRMPRLEMDILEVITIYRLYAWRILVEKDSLQPRCMQTLISERSDS